MKRIIMLAMVLVMLLVSVGGCYIGVDGRGGRGGGYDRDGEHDHDRDQRHEERH
jgi:hypothetical protein